LIQICANKAEKPIPTWAVQKVFIQFSEFCTETLVANEAKLIDSSEFKLKEIIFAQHSASIQSFTCLSNDKLRPGWGGTDCNRLPVCNNFFADKSISLEILVKLMTSDRDSSINFQVSAYGACR
jgi:hypothetical protein